MAINKVVFGNSPLIDLTGDTVTPGQLAVGATAHDASGVEIEGELDTYTTAEVDEMVEELQTELDDLTDQVNEKAPVSAIPSNVSQLQNDANYIRNGTTDDVALNGYKNSFYDGTICIQSHSLIIGSMQIRPSDSGGILFQTWG